MKKKQKQERVPMLPIYVYFVAFEPPMGTSSSMIFQLPRPIRTTEDLRRMEALLNKGREDGPVLVTPFNKGQGRPLHRLISVSLLEEAARPITPEEMAEIQRRRAANEGAKEVVEEVLKPVQES